MDMILLPTRAAAAAPRAHDSLKLRPDEVLLRAGEPGRCWRIRRGTLRVERVTDDALTLIQLAGPGDGVGFEAWQAEPSACTVTAVTIAEVEPWGDDEPARVLAALAHQQQRQAVDMAGLRSGPARQRVARLLGLLARGRGEPLERRALPQLKDLAAIVDSAPETVCRELRRLLPSVPVRRASRPRARALAGSVA
jgi:CRP-like cAMP-binding protein